MSRWILLGMAMIIAYAGIFWIIIRQWSNELPAITNPKVQQAVAAQIVFGFILISMLVFSFVRYALPDSLLYHFLKIVSHCDLLSHSCYRFYNFWLIE